VSEVELARQHWEEGFRRLQAAGDDRALQGRLWGQVETMTAELRRRVGGVYTLSELAEQYRRADTWAPQVLGERAAGAGWMRSASIAADAAFHLYARGAQDYTP
jgi:hypothetical protein